MDRFFIVRADWLRSWWSTRNVSKPSMHLLKKCFCFLRRIFLQPLLLKIYLQLCTEMNEPVLQVFVLFHIFVLWPGARNTSVLNADENLVTALSCLLENSTGAASLLKFSPTCSRNKTWNTLQWHNLCLFGSLFLSCLQCSLNVKIDSKLPPR